MQDLGPKTENIGWFVHFCSRNSTKCMEAFFYGKWWFMILIDMYLEVTHIFRRSFERRYGLLFHLVSLVVVAHILCELLRRQTKLLHQGFWTNTSSMFKIVKPMHGWYLPVVCNERKQNLWTVGFSSDDLMAYMELKHGLSQSDLNTL